MTTELQMLAWTALLTSLLWLPYITARLTTFGIIRSVTYQDDDKPCLDWAERAKKAHYNAIENLVPFATLILVAHVADVSNNATAGAAIAYFWFRVAHYLLYIGSVPFGRTLTFTGSWLAMMCIAYQVLA